MHTFYELFAGGGMARAGLGSRWQCLFANDIDEKKAVSYARNWGTAGLKVADIAKVNAADLPLGGDLAWASFPCQDLSLAGAGAGLKGTRSGTFWPFWSLIKALGTEDRAPRLVVLENVYGTLRSHGGKDFAAIGSALAGAGYRFGTVVIDAIHFVPQSRPRLFIIAVRQTIPIPEGITTTGPEKVWHPPAVVQAKTGLTKRAASKWVWWDLGEPPQRTVEFADLIEDSPHGVKWHTRQTTHSLLKMMSDTNLAKVEQAKKAGHRMVGGLYRRTRAGVQRAEVRFDVSGCLRTPVGGSSRQTILVVDGPKKVRSRLLSPREAARLMGLPDSYQLPENYNEAYHLAGDGVVVPVVRHLAANILEPVLQAAGSEGKEAA